MPKATDPESGRAGTGTRVSLILVVAINFSATVRPHRPRSVRWENGGRGTSKLRDRMEEENPKREPQQLSPQHPRQLSQDPGLPLNSGTSLAS